MSLACTAEMRGRQCRSSRSFFFSSRRRHTRFDCDWSSDVCSSDLFGSQCMVVAIDARAVAETPRRWVVYVNGGRVSTGLDAVAWAQRAVDLGAGEILLTSIDQDGTQDGYELRLTRAVSDAVPVPVIASGGAGTSEHIRQVLTGGGADAALLAGTLHRGQLRIGEVKGYLQAHGIPVRL